MKARRLHIVGRDITVDEWILQIFHTQTLGLADIASCNSIIGDDLANGFIHANQPLGFEQHSPMKFGMLTSASSSCLMARESTCKR